MVEMWNANAIGHLTGSCKTIIANAYYVEPGKKTQQRINDFYFYYKTVKSQFMPIFQSKMWRDSNLANKLDSHRIHKQTFNLI